MTAREEILGRIGTALAGADRSEVPVPHGYRSRPPRRDRIDLFAARVADYRATVTRCGPSEVPSVVEGLLPEGPVLVPVGIPWALRLTPDTDLTARDLDGYAAVVTSATVAVAETGTIVLTHGPGQGRRALSLVPDVHVCVVRAHDIVSYVPDAIARLDPRQPQTWISGPSATSDIELDRVEGVHGPRTLHVVLEV